MNSIVYSPIGAKVYITQWYGEREHVYGSGGHNGLDFRTKFSDTPIGRRYCYSMKDGVILSVKTSSKGYGKHIMVDHGDGMVTGYGHLHNFKVKVGQEVQAGQILGITNNTGFSSASHLHFMILVNGKAIDPMTILGHGMIDPESGRAMTWKGRIAHVEKGEPDKDYKLLYQKEKAERERLESIIKELEDVIDKV